MMASAPLTIDDFERLPADVAENHELVDGELVEVSGNNPLHNHLRDGLVALILPFEAQGFGTVISEQEYDFLGNAHGPDVSFFGPAKRPLLNRKKRVQRFAPDLAVEIASDTDTFDGLLLKMQRYRRAGTQEVWLIAPDSGLVAVFSEVGGRFLEGEERIETPLLPGFSITVRELLSRGI